MSAIKCHRENDTIVLSLPSTVLFLTEDEAKDLLDELFLALARGLFFQNNGEHVAEHLSIASVPISRPEALEVAECMEQLWSDEDIDEWSDTEASDVEPIEESLNWKTLRL